MDAQRGKTEHELELRRQELQAEIAQLRKEVAVMHNALRTIRLFTQLIDTEIPDGASED